jgi:transcriptional regulator with XRE-family HTH domain
MASAGLKDADLASKLGIARSYVTQMRNGRAPSMALALRIHDAIGVQLGPIAGATKAEIAALKRVAERAA